MTLERFLTLIPKGGWRITSKGNIRRLVGQRYYCPITMVYQLTRGKYVPTSKAGAVVLLSNECTMRQIIYAADVPWTDSDAKLLRLRKKLLTACGLAE